MTTHKQPNDEQAARGLGNVAGNADNKLDVLVDQFSIHQPKGIAKGTLARRVLKSKLMKWHTEALKSLEYDKQVADNCRLAANAGVRGTWEDPSTGNKLYNEIALRAFYEQGRIDEAKTCEQARIHDTKALKTAWQIEQAYGGCKNCYGKGYATVNGLWHGTDTDQDIGSPGNSFRYKLPGIKFCTCDRGVQLGKLVADERQDAVTNNLNYSLAKLPRELRLQVELAIKRV